MCNINRVIGPGWNIWVDENDSISQRDTGWIQFYCSSNQEIYDTVIQAFKIAEHANILLPVMVNLNAFILSHTSLPAEIPEQRTVDDFLGQFVPGWKLDVENPVTFGNIIGPDSYIKVRYAMQQAQLQAKQLIPQIGKEWEKHSGFFHGNLIEYLECEDAEYILLAMGAIGAESKVAIKELRNKGHKVGLARVRVFRPFPTEDIIALGKQARLVVIDRNISIGNEGALFTETKAALSGIPDTSVQGYIAGLGGKDVTYHDIETMVEKAMMGKATQQIWYGVGEER
jgi:pyruvate/2-oxoacid:ferredoxin oxidoreductase alpha subunit